MMLNARLLFTRRHVAAILFVAIVVVAGCVSTQRLGEFELENRSVAIMAAIPDDPIVFHELLAARGVRPYDPRGRRAVGIEQREVRTAARLEQQLRTVAERIDMAALLARETGKQSAEILGMRIAEDPDRADYVLDVRVYDYGLLMFSSRERALFFLDAEIALISNETGETVWKQTFDDATAPRHSLNPPRFRSIEHDELAQRLIEFTEHTAHRFIRRLEQAWRRV